MSFEHRPKCKVCGALHFAREPHDFGGAKVAKVDLPSPRSMPTIRKAMSRAPVEIEGTVILPSQQGDPKPVVLAVPKGRHGRPATGFDRKAYQRIKAKERRDQKKREKADGS